MLSKSAKSVPLYDLREEFKGSVGTKFTLRVKGKEGDSQANRTVIVTLADQV